MKDVIGNVVREGSLVRVTLPSGISLRGRIKSICEGGISLIGGTRGKDERKLRETPGVALINCEFEFEADPRTGVLPNVERLHDPTGEDMKAETRH
jgi:hypothetical protein